MTAPACWVAELGQVEYCEAERLQLELVRARRAGEMPDVLLLVEHPPVVTVGRGARRADVHLDAQAHKALGVQVHESRRGGRATYHGPGQMVGYPILDLRALKPDLHWYLRSLEQVLIDSLGVFGYRAQRVQGLTGVWVLGRKVASIGIAVRGWIAYHGFALNLDCRSRAWQCLRPCGLRADQVVSLADLGPAPPLEKDMKKVLAEQFGRVFGREMVARAPEELFTSVVF